jgi:hypothetical protein
LDTWQEWGHAQITPRIDVVPWRAERVLLILLLLKHTPGKAHQFLDLGFSDFLVMQIFLFECFSQLGHQIFQLDGFQKIIESP